MMRARSLAGAPGMRVEAFGARHTFLPGGVRLHAQPRRIAGQRAPARRWIAEEVAVRRWRLVTLLCALACADAISQKQGAAPGTARDRSRIVEIPLGDEPDDVAVGPDHVWVTVPGSHRVFPPAEGWLLEIEPTTGQIVSRIRVGRRPGRVVWAAGAVWVLNSHAMHGEAEPSVMRIDPVREQVTHVVPVATAAHMAGDDSGLWLSGGLGDLWWIDPAAPERLTLLRRRSPRQSPHPAAMAVDEGAVWLLESRWAPGLVARVHKAARETGRIIAVLAQDSYGTDIGVGLGSVWVVNHRGDRGGTVSRLDPSTGELLATIPVEPYPWFLAVCEDGVWVSNGSTVSRIDPAANRVAEVLDREEGRVPETGGASSSRPRVNRAPR